MGSTKTKEDRAKDFNAQQTYEKYNFDGKCLYVKYELHLSPLKKDLLSDIRTFDVVRVSILDDNSWKKVKVIQDYVDDKEIRDKIFGLYEKYSNKVSDEKIKTLAKDSGINEMYIRGYIDGHLSYDPWSCEDRDDYIDNSLEGDINDIKSRGAINDV